MKRTEIILAIFSIISLGMCFLGFPIGRRLMSLIPSILALLYYFLGFAFFNNIKLKQIFKKSSYKGINVFRILGAILTGFLLASVISGIILKLSFPGNSVFLTSGVIGLFVSTIVGFIKLIKSNDNFYSAILKRAITVFVVGLVFIIIPNPFL